MCSSDLLGNKTRQLHPRIYSELIPADQRKLYLDERLKYQPGYYWQLGATSTADLKYKFPDWVKFDVPLKMSAS